MKKAVVSILIINYNGKHLLKIILDSIKKLSFQNYEIVVVDNNSTDGSQDFIKKNYKKVIIVQNDENLGTSGINSGLPYCNGKYIFYLNNDIQLEKNCLSILYEIIESNPSIGLVAPRIINFYNRNIKSGGYWLSRSFYAGHYLQDKTKAKNKALVEIPYAGVFLFRKEIAAKLGYLFDHHYFIYAEDLDFCLRARLLGYKVVLAPDAVIYHMHAATIGKQKSYKSVYFLERNLLSTFLKVLSFKSILVLSPYVVAMRFLAVIRNILRFQFMNALARIRAILWVLLHSNIIYEKRLKLQKMRKVNDKELLRLFSEKYLFKSKPLPL